MRLRSRPTNPFGTNGIQFVQNATQDYDYGVFTTVPNGFGNGEFTHKFVFEPSQITIIGTVQTDADRRTNWASESASPGDSAEWWFDMNFLLDGHNNNVFGNGTHSLGFRASGIPSWLFGDGSGNWPTGGLWGIQNLNGINVLDGGRHVIHLVREWDGGSGAFLRLYVDASLQDTVTTDVRTNMATTYWNDLAAAGYPVSQRNWCLGAEKQAAFGLNGVNDWPDYKGLVREMTFYGAALSASEIAADQGRVDRTHPDYLDDFDFTEGSGTSTTSNNSIVMTLTNPGNFWPF